MIKQDDKPIFTIAIPTYNRPEQLRKRIVELISEENINYVEIIIIDNKSDYAVESIIDELSGILHQQIKVYTNIVNLGIGPNVCRCFEYGTTEWLWLLGDDDSIYPGIITKILDKIKLLNSIQNIGGVNFSTAIYRYEHEITYCSIDDWMNSLQVPLKFGNCLFISSCLYRVDIARKYLATAYLLNCTYSPQFVITMCVLRDGFKWLESDIYAIDFEPCPLDQRWSWARVIYGLTFLEDVPGCRKYIKNNLKNSFTKLIPLGFKNQCFKMYIHGDAKSDAEWLHIIKRIRPYLNFKHSMTLACLYMLLKVSLVVPKISMKIRKIYIKNRASDVEYLLKNNRL